MEPPMTDTVEPITREERRQVMMLVRQSRHGDWFTSPTDVVAQYEFALRAAEERIKKLEEALGPFAQFAENFDDESISDTDGMEIFFEETSSLLDRIPFSAFRRARQALGE